jgi:CheY-like chemotaxis protein
MQETAMSQILLVEDEASIREPLARLLRHEGFSVACATDGQEALGRLEDERPSLVLLDMTMPGMDGLTFLSIVRRDGRFKDLPVFLFTAITEAESIGQAKNFGIEGYCVKGSTPVDELIERIHEQVVN